MTNPGSTPQTIDEILRSLPTPKEMWDMQEDRNRSLDDDIEERDSEK